MFSVKRYRYCRDDKDQYLILRWLSFGSETRQPLPFHWLILVNVKDGAHLSWWGKCHDQKQPQSNTGRLVQRSGSRELWRVAHATGWQCERTSCLMGKSSEHLKILCCSREKLSRSRIYRLRERGKLAYNVARLAFGNYSMMTGIGAAWQRH